MVSEDRDTLAATKLTRTEFAVVRAYAQGMRPVDIANRYLANPDDDDDLTEHQAVQRILALRDRLVQFALQHDRPDIAEMFEALRGRSDAGMSRRVDALSSIEQLGQGRPLPSHRVSLWFGPSLARRLVAADIQTIADLVALANRKGSSWWRHVPRVGQKSSETIVRWLAGQQLDANMRLRNFVQTPDDFASRKPLAGLELSRSMPFPVPLELMRGPPTVGGYGQELAEELGTVREWLRTKESSPNTWKSYRRESERILLWAAHQARSLRSLGATDLEAYRAFLADPKPTEFWCGPASPRDRMHWRPFEGPLRPSSCEAAMRVVRALMRAVQGSPVAPIARLPRPASTDNRPVDIDPISTESLQAPQPIPVDQFLAWLADDSPSPQQRATLAAALLIARHGLRVVELPQLHFEQLTEDAGAVSLSLAAKSAARARQILLEDETRRALLAHWRDRGIDWEGDLAARVSEAALLAPTDFPDTERGRAKRRDACASYSASGLDRLLRASWRRFAAAYENVPTAFTPRQLRLPR